MNIALITDENYIIPTGTAIASILQSNMEEPFHFYIITQKLSSASISLLKSFIEPFKIYVQLEIITINEADIVDLPIRKGDHVSIATYFRIYLPKLIPITENKLLFIDGDTICINSLSNFYNTNITNNSCAVVHDERNDENSIFTRLNYKKENGYFNAGVMLINLDWWRKNNVMTKCLNYIATEPDACLWHDQDALNHVLNGTVLWVDFRYNYMQGFYFDKKDMCIDSKYYSEIDNARKSPCIIHFSSAYKPWHIECNHPLKKQYRNFYKQYAGQKLKLTYKQHGFAKIKWQIKKIIHKLHIKQYADFRQALKD